MALLRIDGLSKTFLLHRVNRRVQGCQDIDFAIEPGQFVGITGRSGSGKSTILRCIWRTNLPERGRILYDSQRFGMLDLAQATQRQMLYLRTYELGYVSQFLNALPRQTAYDIVLKSALEAYGADERSRAEEETERMLRHFARARRRAVASRKGWRARERMFHVKHPEAATEPLAAATFVAAAPCAVAQRRPNGKKHSNSESRAVFSRRRKAERWQNAWSWKTMPRLLA